MISHLCTHYCLLRNPPTCTFTTARSHSQMLPNSNSFTSPDSTSPPPSGVSPRSLCAKLKVIPALTWGEFVLLSAAPAHRILLDSVFVKETPLSLFLFTSLFLSPSHKQTHTHSRTAASVGEAACSCCPSLGQQAEAGGRPAAEHRASGFNEAPTQLDLREVSQSSVAKSTDGLWDCFVGACAESA